MSFDREKFLLWFSKYRDNTPFDWFADKKRPKQDEVIFRRYGDMVNYRSETKPHDKHVAETLKPKVIGQKQPSKEKVLKQVEKSRHKK
jgi:hypothetical protein